MSSEVRHSVVIQFLVSGFGSDEDFDRRVHLEELIGEALASSNNGESTGGDGGSGTMNAFFSVNDPVAARQTILATLEQAEQLDLGVVVAHERFSEDDESAEFDPVIWWPDDYAFSFSSFGPFWKGVPDKTALSNLGEGVVSLQGRWIVTRYDTPDGPEAANAAEMAEWASKIEFLLAGNQLMIRRDVAILSAARIRIPTIGEIEALLIMGANRGLVSLSRYEFRGEELHFCMVPPGEDRPEAIAPNSENQPGRMILMRVE
jgi:hypothetical protein